ncbi:MAG: DUF423 domain-containing protein [Pseudomonadales bacterium]|nr:DUF423 domain-containing protein [Pseudomonadales bacterium]MCP5344505.1 DUF423 domain-containing protein [Pseudomonadales bacterium]
MNHLFLVLAGINGFIAVSLGAFAAHGLKNALSPDLLATFQTGVQYHMYHALALLGVGVLALHFPAQTLLKAAGFLFLAGIVLFSGSLYVLALSGIRWLGAITPLGGVAFLAGWALLAWSMLRS